MIKNGFLVNSQSRGKKAIEYILSFPVEELQHLASLARETAFGYSSKNIRKRLIVVYEATLKKFQK
ncbi:hypothetical protein HZC53_01255 [Candidatus Uhrbacteria bacterium]|nr:hypothetical protein [Candidatus Uhrbacteria bacterium]